jgi:hypothetical protein
MNVARDVAGEDDVPRCGLAKQIAEGLACYEQRVEFGPIQIGYDGTQNGGHLEAGEKGRVVNAGHETG